HSEIQRESIVSQSDLRWQRGLGRPVVEAVRKVGEIRLPRPQLLDHRECLAQGEVRRMRVVAQCVQYQDVESPEHAERLVRNLANIRAVSKIADAETEHGKRAVLEADRQDLLTECLERDAGFDPVESELGHEARSPLVGTGVERVMKDAPDAFLGLLIAIDG